MRPWFEGEVLISEAFMVFDTDGGIADAEIRQRIRRFIEGFAAFASVQQRQVDRRVPADLSPPVNPQLPDFMASGLRERVVTTIETKEAR
jgi:hypothetical protein